MKLFNYVKRNQEMFIIVTLSIILIFCLIIFRDVPQVYETLSLNPLILSIFGTLFGLLLTSYAILFGLIPALSIDTLETNAINSVNRRFFTALIVNLLIIIFGFIIIFFPQNIFLYIQLFLVIFLILLFEILIFYLYLLFMGAKNRAIKIRNKS